MKTSRTVEIWVGLFVAAGMAAFFMLAMKVSNITEFTETDVYTLNARFDNIGGLKVRSPVRMGGVRVGRVVSIDYDNKQLEAVVSMHIMRQHDGIPDDSNASIYTAGLLGEQYISLNPGGSDEFLVNNDVIEETQSAFVLERMVGQFLIKQGEAGAAK